MFSTEQVEMLSAKLNPSVVKQNQKGCDYVEGWFVIQEANRIFGFGNWERLTTDMRQVSGPTKNERGNIGVSYMAKVTISVHTKDGTILREGTGHGHGWAKNEGDAHESAAKEAETDAMKRALMTFGNPFGLALYDKKKTNVGVDELTSKQMNDLANNLINEINDSKTIDELAGAWSSMQENLLRLNDKMKDLVKGAKDGRKAALSEPEEQNILNAG